MPVDFIPADASEKKFKLTAWAVALLLMVFGAGMLQDALGDGYQSGIDLEPVVIGLVLVVVGLMIGMIREYQIKGMTAKKKVKAEGASPTPFFNDTSFDTTVPDSNGVTSLKISEIDIDEEKPSDEE